MEIILAGENFDVEAVNELLIKAGEKPNSLTPETLSASYARISRDPRPIPELRKEAREQVEKARKSNDIIVFGMGHSSIAEHACFNFDLLGISRLAIEKIQRFRLASFTEKSQRYIKLEDDFYIPKELDNNLELKQNFCDLINLQNSMYQKLYQNLLPYVLDKNKELAKDTKNKSLLEGWAKEDARYILSIATHAQMGMTVNARTLENMIRTFSNSNLDEIIQLKEELYKIVNTHTPSLIKYVESTKYDNAWIEALNGISNKITEMKNSKNNGEELTLINAPQNGDNSILAHLIAKEYSISINSANEIVLSLTKEQKQEIFTKAFSKIESFQKVPREFEHLVFEFELNISSSNFAQLKRHRLCTISESNYNIDLGNTIPESIINIGMEKDFLAVIKATNTFYNELKEKFPNSSDYVLTNSHKRKVQLTINCKELFHFIRLRSDQHAQWDIRNLSDKILKICKEKMPLTFMIAGGKHNFETLKSDMLK